MDRKAADQETSLCPLHHHLCYHKQHHQQSQHVNRMAPILTRSEATKLHYYS